MRNRSVLGLHARLSSLALLPGTCLVAALLVQSCGASVDSGGGAPANPTFTSPSGASQSPAAASPSYQPGPDSIGGAVVQLTATGVVVRDGTGREEAVDLRAVRDVWKETSVPASAVELGDQLDVNGSRSNDAFEARYVWVNIGRIDGVIRAIDETGMDVESQGRGVPQPRVQRIEFSQYLELDGAKGVSASQAAATLVVGRQIGAVLYRPRDGAPRATKIW